MKNKGFTLIELIVVIAVISTLLSIVYYLYRGYLERNRAIAITSSLTIIDEELKNINTELYNLSPTLRLVLYQNNYQLWLLNTNSMLRWYDNTFNAKFIGYFPPIILTNHRLQPIIYYMNNNITMSYNNQRVTLPKYNLIGFSYVFQNSKECQIAKYLLPSKITCNNNILTYTLNNGNGYIIGLTQ